MSLKGTEYETVQEASMRLGGTVVLYDGEPVYINEVRHEEDLPKGEIFRVLLTRLPVSHDAKVDRKFISSGKFDLTPLRMGFANLADGHAYFLSRNTARQNRQGLSERSLTVEGLDPNRPPARWKNIIYDKGFVDCVHGKYPSMEDAIKLLTDQPGKSVAISREYALKSHSEMEGLLILHHKLREVGFMSTSDKVFKVGKKFRFLKEELADRNIPCVI